MSALPPDGSSSVSSSGFTDGLGTRLLTFDRETGEMLEQLQLRPELSAFERALNDALARAAAVEDERFARPRRIERDAEGRLSVVSEFVPGRRLSEALDSAADAGIAAGLDAALGLLLELLPAIASFHVAAGMPHGAVGAGRLLFTPAGQLVLLDGIYAASLEHLQLAPARLWRDLGIAAPNVDGPVHFDIAADLAQAALAAAALMVGRTRPLTDYPDGLDDLRREIAEVAQIRASTVFANALGRWLDRLLPVDGRTPFATADEAALELRQILRRELGIEACRNALLDFLSQVETADTERLLAESVDTAPQEQEQLEAERREAERREAERLEAERREQERLEAERLEKERLEAERREKERLEAERREKERLEAERREKERLEAERLEAERREKERLEAERREKERLEAERREKERLEAERREKERLEAERREKERLEAERREKERLEAERREKERLEAERREKERLEAERREKERLEAERREKERLEAERREKERLEAERREKERLEAERLEKERLEAERREKERLEAERRENERLEAERREKERLEKERLEAARREKERLEKERREKERLEKERLEAARREKERLEAERREKERLEAERREKERLEAERREKERLEKERLEAARRDKERLEAERREKERLEAERREQERLGAERNEEERKEKAATPASGRRRKRDKSSRARKDRLRSAQTEPKPEKTAPAASAPPSRSGWLIPPDRAAAFDPPVPDVPVAAAPVPAVPVYQPPPPQAWAPPPMPIPPPAPPPPPAFTAPPVVLAPEAPATAYTAPSTALPAPQPIRLKSDAGIRPVKLAERPRPRDVVREPAPYYAPEPPPMEGNAPRIPWKLAAAAIVVLAAGIAATRAYLPDRSASDAPTNPAVAAAAREAERSAKDLATMGQLVITTQPSGAKVLIDGKQVGETPLTQAVSPGRHVLTLVGANGSVRRTVRVEAGESVTVDAPVFSGWAAIFAPIILDISEGGESLGTTEQERIMLSPGRHLLRLSNKELNYLTTVGTEIEAGQVKTIRLDPRTPMNLNAIPWAEVYIDGTKAGETPLANVKVPLGTREIVFRNPQYGERRIQIIVKTGEPGALSVDFTKPPAR